MRLSVQRIITEAQDTMSANSAYFYLQMANLSIKAEPEALLSLSVGIDTGEADIEEVADVVIPCDDKFILVPKKASYLFDICKAIAMEHPEYKIERKVYQDNGDETNTDINTLLVDETDDSLLEDLVICCTLPEMNEDRRDTSLDLIHSLYDKVKVVLDDINVDSESQLAKALSEAKPEEMDEAKDKMEEVYDLQKKECARYLKEKEESIEKAYQKYLQGENEKEKQAEEIEQAQGKEATKSMSIESLLNPEE